MSDAEGKLTHSVSPHDARAHTHRHAGVSGNAADAVKDPVCGMMVDPRTARFRADEGGKSYFFCSAGCRAKFVAEPAKYLVPAPVKPAAAAPGAIYTCPMHPQIRRVGPGSCPIC